MNLSYERIYPFAPDEKLTHRYPEGKWTIKEILVDINSLD